MGDAMMLLGRSQCREGGAENNCSGERKCCLAEHFLSPGELRDGRTHSYERLPIVFIPSSRNNETVMQTLKVMERVGLENTGVVNINEQTSNLYVSRETAKGLKLIDRGKLVEKEGAPAYVVLGKVNLNRVVHAPMEEADKNLPTEAATQLRPIVEQVYGRGSTIYAQQVTAIMKHLKIDDDNLHCVKGKKLGRKYIRRAGIKKLAEYINEKPLEALRAFGSKAAIQKYEQSLSKKSGADQGRFRRLAQM